MASRVAIWLLVLLGAGTVEGRLRGQSATVTAASHAPLAATAAGVDVTLGGALRSLASRAGVVFVGQVVSIERKGGTVEILFSVQQGVMGSVGGTYRLREWGGLWAAGQQRYTAGERAMLFLHAPNAAGISSPVDGMEGVIPLVTMGADKAALLDVRRLSTRLLRAQGQAMAGEAVTLPDAARVVTALRSEPTREPVRIALPQGVRRSTEAGGNDVVR